MELSAVQVSMISMSLAFCPQLVLPPIAQAEFKMILELFSHADADFLQSSCDLMMLQRSLEETKVVYQTTEAVARADHADYIHPEFLTIVHLKLV